MERTVCGVLQLGVLFLEGGRGGGGGDSLYNGLYWGLHWLPLPMEMETKYQSFKAFSACKECTD